MQNVIPLVQILARGREMFWKEACFDLCIPLHVTSVILREDFFFFLREIYLSVGLFSCSSPPRWVPFTRHACVLD